MFMTNGVLTALPAPEGYDVNFASPQRHADIETYWVASVGNFLAFLFISQRVFTKVVIQRTFQWEDVMLVSAWIASVTTQAVIIHMFAVGVVGVHAWEISFQQYNVYSILTLVGPVFYAPCSGFAKLALLLFYRRLSPQVWFQYSVMVTMVVVICYTIGIFFSLIFACNPIAMNWDITITRGTCIKKTGLYIATAILGIITDVVLFFIPIPMVLGLQMPKRQKFGLLLMFGVGSLTVITSIVRLVILLPVLTNEDQPWALAFPCTWICVEANLLVICGALPTLRKFLRHVAPRIIGEDFNTVGSSQIHSNTNLRTFGSSGKNRKQYNKFGDPEYGMTIFREEPSEPMVEAGGEQVGNQEKEIAVIESHTWDARSGGDGDSVKAILQTTNTTIHYAGDDNRS